MNDKGAKIPVSRSLCAHCGDACGTHPVERSGQSFCCIGCAGVYTLLQQHDLGLYYELDMRPGRKIKGLAAAYTALDDPALSKNHFEYRSDDIHIIRLKLPAIHCSSCIWLLENLAKLHPGVSSTRVHFSKREAVVRFDPTQIRASELAALLDSIGYPPDLSLDAGKGAEARIDRGLTYRLGLTGFAFGNTMLVALPEYFGLDTDVSMTAFFRWVALSLSVPVAAYAGSDYFIASWKSLRKREVSIYLPIALGVLVLTLRSIYEVVTGVGSGYFDSLMGLLFFLLLGKLAQRRTYAALAWDRDYTSFFPMNTTRIDAEGNEVQMALRDLRPGDVLRVRNGELIPADGTLVRGQGLIDYSFATGESEPVERGPGDALYAGGRQRGGVLDIEVEHVLERSRLIQLWNDRAFEKHSDGGFKNLTDRISRQFTVRLLLVALGGAGYWAWADPSMIVPVVTAVLIVACPCALALSAPFALGHALRVFGRNKLYLKGTDAVEALARTEKAVFDKTGTLSVQGEVRLAWLRRLTSREVEGFRALSAQSGHPLSRAIARGLSSIERAGPPAEVAHFEEVKGLGTQALIDGREFRIGKPEFASPKELDLQEIQGSTVLGIDGRAVGRLIYAPTYRPGLRSMSEQLGKMEMGVEVLSGDVDAERERLKGLLGAEAHMAFEQSPMDKLAYVRGLEEAGHRVLMVGDGLNDAGALKASSVGLGVVEEANTFTPACDGILEGEQLHRLGDFVGFARDAVQVVWWSFGLSIAYNMVGLGFALSGRLSPVVSAILMPLSSLSVVLFVSLAAEWRARRRGL